MKFEYGDHSNWREISIRFATFHDSKNYKPFLEINLWKWFITINFGK